MATREEGKLKEVPPVSEGDAPAKGPKRSIRMIVGAVLLVLLAGLGAYWWMNRGYESTDDAQVDTNVAPVPARVGGIVEEVLFEENQMVKAGQPLARIDDDAYKSKVANAEAELASAKAAAETAFSEINVVQASGSKEITSARAALAAASSARDTAQTDLTRAKNLFEEHAITRQKLDAAQNAFDGADANYTQAKARLEAAVSGVSGSGKGGTVEAQIAQAKARATAAQVRVEAAQQALALAKLDLEYTEVKAPGDGLASKKTVVVGQMLQPGQPIAQIVPTTDLWVTANFKETQLSDMKIGQPATITIDAYPGLKLTGKVKSLSGATGARFSLLPAENATGNFTKVVQRVPVRIALDSIPTDRVLRAGLSADVTVNTNQ